MPKDFRYIIQSVSPADVKDAISSLIFESIFWLWHAISFEMLIRVKCFQTDFRIWRTRSWRPTCGWSSTGATTSWPGSPRSMAGSRVSTCRRITSGDQTLSSTTSKQPQYSVQGVQKNVPMFQTARNPSKLALGIKVGRVLKSSGSPLADEHWNFSISIFGGWENGV